jgi:hypothetical protein
MYRYSEKGDTSDGYTAGSVYSTSEQITRSITGNRLPNWKYVIAIGENATTNLTGTWRTVDWPGDKLFVKRWAWDPDLNQYRWKEFQMEGFRSGYHTNNSWKGWVDFTFDNADARASNNFLKKIRAAQVHVSGPVFLGELRETLRMIRKPAAGLQDLVGNYLDGVKRSKNARGRGKGSGKDPGTGKPYWYKDLGNLWLEQAFGWTPLMNDIRDGLSAYNKLIDKTRSVAITGAGKDFYRYGEPDMYVYGAQGQHWSRYILRPVTEQTHVVRYRGRVTALAATTVQDRFARFGFTPEEFIPAAWELLPWSFLVDYFATIGDFIEGTVTNTSNCTYVNKSDIRWIKSIYNPIPDTSGLTSYSKWTYNLSSSPLIKEDKTFTRSPSGVPTPQIELRIPTSLGKLTNMLALFAQVSSSLHPQQFRTRNFRL